MDNILETCIRELEKVETVEEFENFTARLDQLMQLEKIDMEIVRNIRAKEKYLDNKFSDLSTKANMTKAKESLMLYLKDVLNENCFRPQNEKQNSLERYLNNFYLFLEGLNDTRPDKRATLTAENLQNIQIKNEYDLQHLLYAVLKPLFIDTRKEVTEDSGIGAIRSDIKIESLNSIIEAKCTRKTMSLKKLTEELEADIVHYKADFIYFYIYDKDKTIKDRQNFETNFNKNFDGKKVKVIILQPIKM